MLGQHVKENVSLLNPVQNMKFAGRVYMLGQEGWIWILALSLTSSGTLGILFSFSTLHLYQWYRGSNPRERIILKADNEVAAQNTILILFPLGRMARVLGDHPAPGWGGAYSVVLEKRCKKCRQPTDKREIPAGLLGCSLSLQPRTGRESDLRNGNQRAPDPSKSQFTETERWNS